MRSVIEAIEKRWSEISQAHKASVVLGFVLLVSLGFALAKAQRATAQKPSLPPLPADPAPASTTGTVDTFEAKPAEPNVVAVHVAGRVKTPGVYRLPNGALVDDAIKAAGGALPDADTDSVNLAAKLVDGKQLYLPSKKQTAQVASGAGNGRGSLPSLQGSAPSIQVEPAYVPERLAPPAASSGSSSSASKPASPSGGGSKSSASDKLRSPGDGTVHLNSAGLKELQRLPGVGESTAQKILDYRKENGPFKTVDELMNVKGIGPKKLEKMKSFLAL